MCIYICTHTFIKMYMHISANIHAGTSGSMNAKLDMNDVYIYVYGKIDG